MTNLSDDFYNGVLVALTEVDRAGQETLFEEIVGLVGENDLVRVARKRGEMRFTGMSRYLREQRERVKLGLPRNG